MRWPGLASESELGDTISPGFTTAGDDSTELREEITAAARALR